MSRGPQDHEFAPNEGVKLPRIQDGVFDQTFQETKERENSRSLWEEEGEIFLQENQALANWCISFSLSTGREGLVGLYARVFHRILRKQAEADAMSEDISTFDQYQLPRVLGDEEGETDPETVLPVYYAKSNKEFGVRTLKLIEEENPEIILWLSRRVPEDAKSAGVVSLICGMYWLLKYHSKPREEKKT